MPAPEPDTRARRLLWFGALWLASVTVVFVVAWVIRLAIVP